MVKIVRVVDIKGCSDNAAAIYSLVWISSLNTNKSILSFRRRKPYP